MAEKDKQIVIIREHRFENYLGDALTLGYTSLAFWFNYRFIGGNDAFDVLLFIIFFMFVFNRSMQIYKQVREYLEESK